MKVEIEAASSWWTDHLPSHLLSAKQSHLFQSQLSLELERRCNSHWYTDAPLRGSGYRSVIHDARLDPTLESAGRVAGIEKHVLYQVLPRGVMWLNPGEVKIRLNGMSPNENVMVIYSSKNQQRSPPATANSSSSSAAVVAATSKDKQDDSSSSSSLPASCSSSQSSSPSPSSSPMTPTSMAADIVGTGASNDAGFLLNAVAAGSFN